MSPKFNKNLHGLRGLAALAVFAFHWQALFPEGKKLLQFGGREGQMLDLSVVLGFGWLGVSLFFVLSGYLLADKLRTSDLTLAAVQAYWQHRAARILPAYWTQLLVLSALTYTGAHWLRAQRPVDTIAHIFLWLDPLPGAVQPLNGVWWTLPVEMMFYGILPLLIVFARRFGMAALLFATIAITFSWRYGVMVYRPTPDQSSNLTWLNALPGSLSIFALGAAAAYTRQELSSFARTACIALGLLGVIASCAYLLAHLDTYWQRGLFLTTWTTINALAITAIVLGYARTRSATRILGSTPAVWLGDISFGIYLWHFPVMLFLNARYPALLASPQDALYALLITLAITLVLAWASFRLIERPAMHWAASSSPSAADRCRQS